MIKSNRKNTAKFETARVKSDSKQKAIALLEIVNKKKIGRKVKFFDLFELAIGLVTEDNLKTLHERSLSNEDRKEVLRHKYISIYGPISKDDFTGFLMTPAYFDFLKEHGQTVAS